MSLAIISRNIIFIICLYSGSSWKAQSGCKLHYAKYVYEVLQSSSLFNERWVNLSSISICEKPQLPVPICTGLYVHSQVYVPTQEDNVPVHK